MLHGSDVSDATSLDRRCPKVGIGFFAVAHPSKESMRVVHPVIWNDNVEVAHEPIGGSRILIGQECDRTLYQERCDADAIQFFSDTQ